MTPIMKLINALNAVIVALQEVAAEELKTEMGTFEEIYTPPELKDQPEEKDDSQEEPPKSVTLEEVRSVLSSKNRAGFKKEVRALLKKHGADRLSEIKEEEYAALLKEGEKIGT